MNFLINPTIHPLLQILITLFLCSGILNFGKLINQKFFKNYNYYFFDLSVGTIFLSQILLISLVLGVFEKITIVISFLLLLLGILNINLFKKIRVLLNFLFVGQNRTFKIIITISLLSFIIISLGPPSMADALDYHYGVPLFLLEYSYLPNQDIWLHGSLFGNGELMNAIGLYLKTDNFFTFFQLFSLILFFEFLSKKEKNQPKLFFIIFFIISSPVILFLISGPKPLLFPQLLTAAALYIFIKEKNFNQKNIILIGILLMGAAQFKLSFILSGTILGLFILIKVLKNEKKIILYLLLLGLIAFLPKLFYNLAQVSEFNYINIFTTLPKIFLEALSNYQDNNYIYPINLFIPGTFGAITTILGFQIFILFFIKKTNKEFNLVLILTFLTTCLHFIFGQQTSRLYFEFLLWIAVGFCFLETTNFKNKFITYILLPQLFVILVIGVYFSINTLPSLFSLDSRDKFMKNNSFEYSGIKWINKQIPPNDIIISELRSYAFFTNEVIPLENTYKLQETKNYIKHLKLKKPNFIITKKKDFDNHFLKDCVGKIHRISENFRVSTRNPFNQGNIYKVYIYHFNSNKLNYCTNFK
jgi:hypothetical protein